MPTIKWFVSSSWGLWPWTSSWLLASNFAKNFHFYKVWERVILDQIRGTRMQVNGHPKKLLSFLKDFRLYSLLLQYVRWFQIFSCSSCESRCSWTYLEGWKWCYGKPFMVTEKWNSTIRFDQVVQLQIVLKRSGVFKITKHGGSGGVETYGSPSLLLRLDDLCRWSFITI